MAQLSSIPKAGYLFFPFHGLYLNGSLLSFKKTRTTVHHQGVTIQSLLLFPLVWHLSFSPSWLPRSFQLPRVASKHSRCFGLLLSLLQIGFIYIDSKCDKKQTNNYPHGPHIAPLVTQMEAVWQCLPAPALRLSPQAQWSVVTLSWEAASLTDGP